MRYIGIDPGSEPAVCILDEKGEVVDIVKFKKSSKDPNFRTLDIFHFLESKIDSLGTKITIEQVHSVHKSSAKANFTFGKSVGSLGSIAEIAAYGSKEKNITINYVQPKIWQNIVWEAGDIVMQTDSPKKKDTKLTSLMCARRILGDKWSDSLFLPTLRSSTLNHDMIDAFLIARSTYKLLTQ